MTKSLTATWVVSLGALATAGAAVTASQLVSAAAVTGSASASAPKTDFTIAAQPGSMTVQAGKSGSYSIDVGAVGGFSGSVTLSTSGLPSGVSGAFSPTSVALGSASQATSSLAVVVSKTAPLGSYTFTVTGASGTGKSATAHSTSVGLTIQKQAGSLSVTATPSPLTIDAGSNGSYDVSVTRSGAAGGGSVILSLAGTLPAGAVATFASFDPATVTSTSLNIETADTTPAGTYPLTINATAGDYTATTSVSVVVAAPSSHGFTISDPAVSLLPLSPGAPPRSLNLRITNPNKQQLAITNLTVSVNQPVGSTCSQANFAVTQIPSGYPILVPANAADFSLSGVLSSDQLPTLLMRNLSTNQDICKGTTVALLYAGSGNSN